jgi:plastocyanin
MHRAIRFVLMGVAAVALAACSNGSASQAPGGSSAASGCTPSTSTATVAATIAGFKFAPATITAKVGDVIGWTNNDTANHSAVLDDNSSCTTGVLGQGKSGALTFSAPGTYAYHCGVHGNSMKGSITVSG